ncbi:amino acid transmembrane transporter [Balamuthia mandrillaris]
MLSDGDSPEETSKLMSGLRPHPHYYSSSSSSEGGGSNTASSSTSPMAETHLAGGGSVSPASFSPLSANLYEGLQTFSQRQQQQQQQQRRDRASPSSPLRRQGQEDDRDDAESDVTLDETSDSAKEEEYEEEEVEEDDETEPKRSSSAARRQKRQQQPQREQSIKSPSATEEDDLIYEAENEPSNNDWSGNKGQGGGREATYAGGHMEEALPSNVFLRALHRLFQRIDAAFSLIVPSGGVLASIFVLLSATLGAGSLALPYAVRECGLALALFLLLLGSSAAFYSIHLLTWTSRLTGRQTYEELVEHVFGRKVEVLLELSIIVFGWGSTVAYMVAIGDTLPPLVELLGVPGHLFIAKRWFLLIFTTVVVVFPLCLMNKLDSLRFTSFLGFLATCYLILTIMGLCIRDMAMDGLATEEVEYANANQRLFVGLPIIFYAFSSHINIFSISQELHEPTQRRLDLVALGTALLALIVYTIIGVFGYLSFLGDTEDNILKNYDVDNKPIQIGAMALTISIVFYIPLNTHPCRITVDWMLFRNQSKFPQRLRYLIETIVLVFLALVLAIAVPSIVVVFGLLGATATAMCCYIMPPALHLKIGVERWYHPRAWLSWLLVIGGSITAIASTVILSIDLVNTVKEHFE